MLKKVKRIIGIVLLASFLITFIYIGIIRVTGNVPTFFGLSLIRVTDDNMEPVIDVGEIVISKKTEPEKIELGDVVAYKATRGAQKGSLVVSQVSKTPYEKDGVYYFTTRGIEKDVVDDLEFSESQLRGKVTHVIPYVGTIYDFFTQWYGIVAFVFLILIIFSSEILEFFSRITQREEIDVDEHNNIEDLRRSESIEGEREQEFEGIITVLDDTDE